MQIVYDVISSNCCEVYKMDEFGRLFKIDTVIDELVAQRLYPTAREYFHRKADACDEPLDFG